MSSAVSGRGSNANVQRSVVVPPSTGSITQSSRSAANTGADVSSTRYVHRRGSSQASIVSRYLTPPTSTQRRVPTPGVPSPSYEPSSTPGNQPHVDGSALIAANTASGGAATGSS